MEYSRYKQKLEKIADKLYTVWRFKYLIIAGVVLIAALVLALCFISGNIYGVSCPSSVEYGTPLGFEAKAVFAATQTEYYVSGEWTTEEPAAVGEYKVRAVSGGVFGTKYSEEYDYTITVKNTSLTFNGSEFEYGDDPETSVELAYSDAVAEIEYEYEYLGDSVYNVTASVLAVENADGRDVTDSYNISSATGQLTCVARKITISTGVTSKTYDGEAVSAPSYEITGGSLVDGQSISLTYPEFVNAGTYDNQPEVTICDGDGNDVSHNYSVTFVCGKIEVLQREITIGTGSASKTYDGAALSAKTCDLQSGSLVNGHEIDVTYPEFVNAGSYSNAAEVTLYDGAGNDMTGNYNINYNLGTLTISRRQITISTDGAEKVYDGEPLSCTTYQLTGTLVSGHTLSLTAESVSENTITEITDGDDAVGYHKNALAFTVSYGGEDVTDNYEINYNYGNLRIKTPVIVALYSYSKYYDGTALSFKGGYAIVKKPPDVTVDSCTISNASITNVGSVLSDEFSITGITIKDIATGANVNSENGWYIEEGDTVLEVKQREIEVTSVSVSMDKTGSSLTDDTTWISLGSLVDGHTIAVIVIGELSPSEETAVNTISSVTIYDKSGNDVTENYSITLKEGTLSWL